MLLKEIPGFALRNHSEFLSLLSAFSGGGGKCRSNPLVIVATESNSGSSGNRGPLSEENMRGVGAEAVSFNPASATLLVKALKAALESEAARARESGKSFKVRQTPFHTFVDNNFYIHSASMTLSVKLRQIFFGTDKGVEK